MNTTIYQQVKKCMQKWQDYPDVYDSSDPKNRQALIEKNMRLAVDIALRYRGQGMSEEELISSAFYGLALAYDKYKEDNPRNTRYKLLQQITDATTYEEFRELIFANIKYGKVLKMFANAQINTPDDMREFVRDNVPAPKFSSVAYFWITATVSSDLARNRKQMYMGGDECDVDNADDYKQCLAVQVTDDELEDRLELLWDGIDEQSERMLLLRNGIGCDGKLTYSAIGEEYGMSQNEARDIINATIAKLKANIAKYGLQMQWFLAN